MQESLTWDCAKDQGKVSQDLCGYSCALSIILLLAQETTGDGFVPGNYVEF